MDSFHNARATEIDRCFDQPDENQKFECLYDCVKLLVLNATRSWKRQDREDLVQEVALEILRGGPGVRREHFVGWVFIMQRLKRWGLRRKLYRTANHELALDKLAPILADNAADHAGRLGSGDLVAKLLKCLNEREKFVISMRFVQGYSYKEISRRTESSEAALQQVGSRAIRKLATTAESLGVRR